MIQEKKSRKRKSKVFPPPPSLPLHMFSLSDMLKQWVQGPKDKVSAKLQATVAQHKPPPKTHGVWAHWTTARKQEIGKEVHARGVRPVYNRLRLEGTPVPKSTLRGWRLACQGEEVLQPVGRPRVLHAEEETALAREVRTLRTGGAPIDKECIQKMAQDLLQMRPEVEEEDLPTVSGTGISGGFLVRPSSTPEMPGYKAGLMPSAAETVSVV